MNCGRLQIFSVRLLVLPERRSCKKGRWSDHVGCDAVGFSARNGVWCFFTLCYLLLSRFVLPGVDREKTMCLQEINTKLNETWANG